MRKFLPVASIFFLLLISPSAQAAEFSYARAFNDYLYNLGKYRQVHQEYIVARQAFLNYKTLTSENTAREKTQIMLRSRDEVVRTYLTAIRTRLAETTGVANYEQSVLYLKLDDEILWYEKHKDSLPSAGSLADLAKTAQEASDRWQETEILAYKTLELILRSKEISFSSRLAETIETLKIKIGEIRQKQDKETELIERWLLEAENRLNRSKEKQNDSLLLIKSVKSYQADKRSRFFTAQFALEESHQYLKEVVSNLEELIREVKSRD